MQIFITIVILLVMLGILVSAHEAGHLVMAKAFNVYCLEYSIGFGPKLLSWKKKTGETRFSIRAIPLGGYVSMFGEGVDLPEGVVVPPERSLNGVSAWKRSLILSAGILVNFFLSMVFVVIYATCIKTYYTSQLVYTGLDANGQELADTSEHGEVAYSFWVKGSVGNYTVPDENTRVYSPFGFANNNTEYFVVDPEAKITNGGVTTSYVTCFTPTSLNDNNFLNNLTFFPQKEAFYPNALNQAMGLTSFPDYVLGKRVLAAGDSLSLEVTFIGVDKTADRPVREQFKARVNNVHEYTPATEVVDQSVTFSNNTLWIYSYQYYAPFGQALKNACYYYSRYFTGIGEGFKAIFSFDFSNLGSVVAMGGLLNTESAQIGWGRTFFFYGGYLSLNLAIFNLLPFPGLDGWQLLVTIIESSVNGSKRKKWEREEKAKVKKTAAEAAMEPSGEKTPEMTNPAKEYQPWKINDKIKNTVSAVGLALLFVFAIAITIKDIVSLFR